MTRVPDLISLRAPISNGALKGDALPKRIKIFGWGGNDSIKGNFRVGDKTAEVLSANQRSLGFETVAIDLNHCTVPGSPEYEKGKPKSIFGYGKPVVVKGDGLWLEDVEWTPLGVEHARNYKDLSPAAHVEGEEVDFIHSVGLTPNGCLHDVTFFSAAGGAAAKERREHKEDFNMKKELIAILAAAFAMPETSDEAAVIGKLKTLAALEPLSSLVKDGKVIVLSQVDGIDSRLKAVEAAGTKSLALLSATIDGKTITFTGEDVVKLSTRVDSLESLLKEQKTAEERSEKASLLTLFATDGKAPIDPATQKPYAAAELAKLDVTTLRVLHANTPVTVPLSARGKQPVEGKTLDPNLKGRARMVAAFEAENRN